MRRILISISAWLTLTTVTAQDLDAHEPSALTKAATAQSPGNPLHVTLDLDIGEQVDFVLSDDTRASVKLVDVQEVRDSVRSALREARVTIEINGAAATIVSGNYRLPTPIGGVQVDCTATKGLYQHHDPWEDSWGLDKAVRLRLWPLESVWMPPGEFVYPLRQRWFATLTQMGNEPAYVDGGDAPAGRPIYYHNGLDLGGSEGMADVIAATDGLVVSAGEAALPGFFPGHPAVRRGLRP